MNNTTASAERLIELLKLEDNLLEALCRSPPSDELGDLAEKLADVDDEIEALIESLGTDVLSVTIVQITTLAEPVAINQKEGKLEK